MERKTALYDMHVKYEGKLVPFAGYMLPVQYKSGIIAEHMAVRTKAGLFDVSHMGEIICRGKDALKNLQYILTNDFTNMPDGKARYSPMCNEQGGMIDDLIVYKYADDVYFIVVNAANKDKDFNWMAEHRFGQAIFEDISDTVSQLAIQGPNSRVILEKLIQADELPEKYYSAQFDCEISGMRCVISKTGYTGEDGYEIYLSNENAPILWDMLLEAGEEYGLIPCGLGARDTLRLEAAMPLYGHEMDDTVTPLETGLDFAVKLAKEDFIGKKAMEAKLPSKIKRVGLKVTGRGIIREHEEVLSQGKVIGQTTSGTHAPYLGYPVAMALLDANDCETGKKVEVIVRGRSIEAEIIDLPFYKRAR